MKKILLMIIIILMCTPFLHADEDRPKLGVALSGGGAMGLAHIGVLEYLESEGIKIDYIAGTSMGSVIGGLYASGMSIDEIKKVTKEVDWANVFDDNPERKYFSFKKKTETRKYFIDLEFGLKDWDITIPKGLSAGQKLSYILNSITLYARDAKSFDDFPIPFRAVATNIVDGKKVVLKDGSLAQAIRASMAVPLVFTPVEINGDLLVDGGLVENLPVKTVKDMGADIVLAIDVSEPLMKREDITNMFSIMVQSFKIYGLKSAKDNAKIADYVVYPNLDGLSPVDFNKVDAFVERGKSIMHLHADEIKKLVSDHRVDLDPNKRIKNDFAPTFVIAQGSERVSPRVVEAFMKKSMDRNGYETLTFQRDISRLYGTGYYEEITFEPITNENDEEGILLNVREKTWGPNYVHFGLDLQTNFSSDTYFTFLANINFAQLNPLGGEIRNEIKLGHSFGIASEFYQPVTYNQSLFIAPGVIYDKDYRYLYKKDSRISEFEVESFGTKFDVGYLFSNKLEFRHGVNVGMGKAEVMTGDPWPEGVGEEFFVWLTTSLQFDTLNSNTIPTKGAYFDLTVDTYRKMFGNVEDFDIFKGAGKVYFTIKDKHTFGIGVTLGASFDKVPYYNYFYIGGLNGFSGYKRDQLVGRYVGISQMSYYYKIAKSPSFFCDAVYVGGWVNVGNVWKDRTDLNAFSLRYSATFGLALDTIIGPVYFAYAMPKDRDNILYLGIGNDF